MEKPNQGHGTSSGDSFDKDEVLADFRFRQEVRQDYPGLCAEDYARIMEAVIKHIFQWDDETQESTGEGLFSTLLGNEDLEDSILET